MLRWFVPSLSMVALLAACQVDLGEDLQFECSSDLDCSDGFVCRDSPSVGTQVCVSEAAVSEEDAGDASDTTEPDTTADVAPGDADIEPDADPCGQGETRCGDECVDTSTDFNHCGGCDQACRQAPANSSSTCEAGSCAYSCKDGFSDSDGDWAGIEEPLAGTNGCDIECTPTNGGVEICDDQDNDCDTEVDEGLEETYYPDEDADDFGDEDNGYTACQPTDPNHVTRGGDCDDNEPAINPGVPDTCQDGIDNDCDGTADNGSLVGDEVVAGADHSCALVAGQPYCWGKNDKGQLGDGTSIDRDRPTAVDTTQVGDTFEKLAAGRNFTCGLTLGKEVWCWGSNRRSALGQVYVENDPTTTQMSKLPVQVQNLPQSDFLELAAGSWHVCGVTASQEVYCWGSDGNEQLGREVTNTHTEMPGKVDGSHAFIAVTAGANHTWAIEAATNSAYCWGRNVDGQVGDGSSDSWIDTPSEVDSTLGFQMIAAGNNHTCATDGTDAYCWGANLYGEVGDGTTTQRRAPVNVQGAPGAIASVAGGWEHSCGRVTTGDIVCWGRNEDGQLGDGTTNQSETAVTVQSTDGFWKFGLGAKHTCGQSTNNDEILCWGSDQYGQLGNGASSSVDATTPEIVLCPQ